MKLQLDRSAETAIDVSCGSQVLTAAEPSRFRNSGLGDNMRELFRRAGLPPLSPHAFRHGHATHALKMAKDVADLKAVSMNLRHSSLTITDSIHAVLSDKNMGERIAQLGRSNREEPGVAEIVKRVMAQLAEQK